MDFADTYFRRNCDERSVLKINDSINVLVELRNCLGEMNTKTYLHDSIKVSEGNYSCSPDTMKRMVFGTDIFTFKDSAFVQPYFYPLREGEWQYFNPDGSVLRRELYHNVILQDK